MEPVIISAALTGSRPTKATNPAVPYAPQEIAAEALACWRQGAAVVHIHARDPISGAPRHDPEIYGEIVGLIRRECDVIVNLTTSGLHLHDPGDVQARLAPLEAKPDMCSLDVGSVNFRQRVFINPPSWSQAAARAMQASGVKPELEVFELGHIAQARHLIEAGLIDPPPWFQLCLGAGWGAPATPANLVFMQRQLPHGCQWSVLGVGPYQTPMITLALALGGHVRVGFEDNLYLRKGELAKSNADFVRRAVALAESFGRTPADPAQAREILGLQK